MTRAWIVLGASLAVLVAGVVLAALAAGDRGGAQ